MSEIDSLALSLQPHYSRFNVSERLLFTGHSHQAWPDTAFEGLNEYMDLVSGSVDLKWEKAFEKTEILRNLFTEQKIDSELIRLKLPHPNKNPTGGFLSLTSPLAHRIRGGLLEKNVYTDSRGSSLRIGPAPYTTDNQCLKAIEALTEVIQKF